MTEDEIAWDLTEIFSGHDDTEITENMNRLSKEAEDFINDYKGKINTPDFTSQKLLDLKKINIKEVDDYINYPTDSNKTISKIFHQADKNDRATAYFLFDDLIERAARLSAICLSAVVIKSGAGANPCYPVCISAEGTTFYKFNSLKARIESYLNGYLKKRVNRYYQIVKIKNASLIGAAIAGLTN